jgi:hypothetical protein
MSKKIIDLPCDLGETLYWAKKDGIWECEFWGIQYYKGLSDSGDPLMYLRIPAIKQPLYIYDMRTGGLIGEGYWTDDLRQPKLSHIGKTIFADLDKAKAVISNIINVKRLKDVV